MTRFVKVSLSIVALLLVTLLAFTGCGNKALTAAEEAKAAVVTATEELEAALAKKADAATLAEKVEALTKAVNAAETAAADGDAALNKALADAKTALEENAKTIVAALDAEITTALNSKADKAIVDAELARLGEVIDNINAVLGTDFIKVEDFVEFSTTVAYYVYELEAKWAEIQTYDSLYDGGIPEELFKAYTTAHVVLYRATSMNVIDQAFAEFEAAMAKNPNPIDTIYFEHVKPFANGDRAKYETAAELYAYVAGKYSVASAKAKELMADYYGNGNLVLIPLEFWRADVTEAMTDIAGRYVVYPESTDYTDAADITATETAKTNFTAAVTSCQTAFGTDAAKVLAVPTAYTANVTRMNLLKNGDGVNFTKGAKAAAADVDALALTDADLAKLTNAALDQATIDKVVTWKNAYDKWISVFAPVINNPTADDTARYNANAALVATSKAGIYGETGAIAKLQAIAAPFIADAKEAYMDLVAAKFYDEDGDLDLNKVVYASGADIDAAMNGMMEWMDGYTLGLDFSLVLEPGQKSPQAVALEILDLQVKYTQVVEAAITDWEALPHTEVNALVAGTTKINIYNETVAEVLEWIRIYATKDNAITWNTKVDGADAFVLVTDDGNVTVTKAYYDKLVALKNTLEDLIEYKQGKADALNAALNALATTKLSAFEANAITKVTDLDTAYVAGTHADLPAGIVAEQVAYDATKTAENDALEITIAYGTKLVDAATRFQDLKDLKTAIDTAVETLAGVTVDKTQYPHFAAGVQATYEANITAVETAITNFSNLNGGKETYATVAEAAIAEAKIIVAHENVCKAEAALKALKLNALPSYFDSDAGTAVTDKTTYTNAKNALDTAIAAYKELNTTKYNIATAEAETAKAATVLAKEAAFDRYNTKYAEALTAVNSSALGTDDKTEVNAKLYEIYNEYQKKVNAYGSTINTTEDNLNFANFEAVVNAVLTEANV